jgi:hypothetical protein
LKINGYVYCESANLKAPPQQVSLLLEPWAKWFLSISSAAQKIASKNVNAYSAPLRDCFREHRSAHPAVARQIETEA